MKLKNHQISLIIIIIVIIPLSKSSMNNCISINSNQNSTSNSIKNNILYITNNISQSDCFSQSLSSSLKCCYKQTKFEYENNKTSSNFNKIISTQGTCYPFYDFNNISNNKENYFNQLKAFYKEFKFFAENITKSIYYYGNVNYLNEIIECPNNNEFLFNISNIDYSENELKIINSGSTCFDYSLNLNNSLEISQEICNKSNILKDSIEAGNECCFIQLIVQNNNNESKILNYCSYVMGFEKNVYLYKKNIINLENEYDNIRLNLVCSDFNLKYDSNNGEIVVVEDETKNTNNTNINKSNNNKINNNNDYNNYENNNEIQSKSYFIKINIIIYFLLLIL